MRVCDRGATTARTTGRRVAVPLGWEAQAPCFSDGLCDLGPGKHAAMRLPGVSRGTLAEHASGSKSLMVKASGGGLTGSGAPGLA